MHARESAPPIEAVIFDLGRVLIDVQHNGALLEVGRHAHVEPAVLGERLARNMDILDAFEIGAYEPEEFHRRLTAALGVTLTFKAFESVWNSVFTGEIAPTAALARQLQADARVRVAALSNTNAIHVEHMRSTWPLFSELTNVFLSNEIGKRKPQPAAFQHVVDALGVRPERVVFVDDLEENVAAARTLGMHGVVAHSPQAVADGLRQLGVVNGA
ncbi:MAG: HAD family phosphatase [Planctomycetes bacterium]|nr:HAD family phosphatase [Planctomycetota bacterium]